MPPRPRIELALALAACLAACQCQPRVAPAAAPAPAAPVAAQPAAPVAAPSPAALAAAPPDAAAATAATHEIPSGGNDGEAARAAALDCATAAEVPAPDLAAARAGLEATPARRAELVRGWGCKSPQALRALVAQLEQSAAAADPRAASDGGAAGEGAAEEGAALRVLCAFAWEHGLPPRPAQAWEADFHCPDCPATECEPECDCKAPDEEDGKHNTHACLVAYALERAYFTSAKLPSDIAACKASAQQAEEAWQQQQRARTLTQDAQVVASLLAKGPLDDAQWTRLGEAFIDLHYGDLPEANPSGDKLLRAKGSLVTNAQAALGAAERAQVLQAFAPPGAPPASDDAIATVLETAQGKAVLLLDGDRKAVFFLGGGKLLALDGPRVEKQAPAGFQRQDVLFDVVDADGDGAPEVVLRRYHSAGDSVTDAIELISARSPPRLRVEGARHQQDTTWW